MVDVYWCLFAASLSSLASLYCRDGLVRGLRVCRVFFCLIASLICGFSAVSRCLFCIGSGFGFFEIPLRQFSLMPLVHSDGLLYRIVTFLYCLVGGWNGKFALGSKK
ncbi:hypothetical protein Dimus_017418 [Dionaea muscipula]